MLSDPLKNFPTASKKLLTTTKSCLFEKSQNRLPARPNPENEPSDDITTSENKSRLLVIQKRRTACCCDMMSAASRLNKSREEGVEQKKRTHLTLYPQFDDAESGGNSEDGLKAHPSFHNTYS